MGLLEGLVNTVIELYYFFYEIEILNYSISYSKLSMVFGI